MIKFALLLAALLLGLYVCNCVVEYRESRERVRHNLEKQAIVSSVNRATKAKKIQLVPGAYTVPDADGPIAVLVTSYGSTLRAYSYRASTVTSGTSAAAVVATFYDPTNGSYSPGRSGVKLQYSRSAGEWFRPQ